VLDKLRSNYNYILANDCGFRHLRKTYKNLFTVETVESSSQQSEKRRFRLRVFFTSVSQWRHKIECEGLECIKNGLELSHALVSSFLRLIYSCKRNYVYNTTFILWNFSFFGLSVSWRQLFLQMYWLVAVKKNNIWDDRILQLERLAYKGQPTKEECLTLQTELSEVCLFW